MKIINFGMGATGIEQFATILEKDASRYNPDLVVVAYVSDDVNRKFLWMSTEPVKRSKYKYEAVLLSSSLPATFNNPDCQIGEFICVDSIEPLLNDPQMRQNIHKEMVAATINKIPWFSISPELIASTQIGKSLGMKPKIISPRFGAIQRYTEDEESVAASGKALHKIIDLQKNLLIVHMPVMTELLERDSIKQMIRKYPAVRIATKLETTYPDIKIIQMIQELPRIDSTEADSWFKKDDGHLTNKGAANAATAMHKIIRNTIIAP